MRLLFSDVALAASIVVLVGMVRLTFSARGKAGAIIANGLLLLAAVTLLAGLRTWLWTVQP